MPLRENVRVPKSDREQIGTAVLIVCAAFILALIGILLLAYIVAPEQTAIATPVATTPEPTAIATPEPTVIISEPPPTPSEPTETVTAVDLIKFPKLYEHQRITLIGWEHGSVGHVSEPRRVELSLPFNCNYILRFDIGVGCFSIIPEPRTVWGLSEEDAVLTCTVVIVTAKAGSLLSDCIASPSITQIIHEREQERERELQKRESELENAALTPEERALTPEERQVKKYCSDSGHLGLAWVRYSADGNESSGVCGDARY
jgi:hypothetical protein